ncbi:DUF4355 domain-containing protein [Peribacillus butanolivorans]|uniref:DUF4355 domain-containing protein n=1 Tax=Peribacillus butanolivorans TaxID=421767 RepID=UPI002E247DE8|nr:DUF4355 domain-containing protein [Peribacillus butanolivorans]
MNIEAVKAFLESNKENQDVIGLVKQYAPNQEFGFEQAKQLLETNEDAKRWLDSEKDRHYSKGLETFKTKTMPTLIDEEIKKRNPDKSPEAIELDNLKAKFEQMENEKVRESLKNKALTVASEKKIPAQIIDFFIGQDEATTISNLSAFETAMETYIKAQVTERLNGSYKPPGDNKNQSGVKNPWNKESFNLTEQAKILKENPELAKQLASQSK